MLCTAPPGLKIDLTIHHHPMCMSGASNSCSIGPELLSVGWSTGHVGKIVVCRIPNH